jgi:cephalosporin hydroxylase
MQASDRSTPAATIPSPVRLPFQATVGELWLARTRQHFEDTYAGVPMLQFPEDLRVLEHLLWLSRPNVVIEIGAQSGGSTLWYRDRLRSLQGYGLAGEIRVVAIDIDTAPARAALAAADPDHELSITLLESDILDPELPARVREIVGYEARCLVVEDSAHTYATTMGALRSFAGFVAPGGFFVVEDGCVDVEEMRVEESWPRGVLPAVREWLADPAGEDFVMRRDLEVYGISCHPEGFLQRRPA